MEDGRQDPDGRRNIFFIMYLVAVIILAAVYFSVPERTSFFQYQQKWWSEMWSVVMDRDRGQGIGEKKD